MNLGPRDTELEPPFEAYRGDEPFIFVSYAHRDSALVYPELERWHGLGYRIWYDEGIDPGNEWPEAVANALNGCSGFVVFVSPVAVGSKNVRDEVYYALDRAKPVLAIHLVETALPHGLALRISSVQAIMKWRMSEGRYRRALALALPAEVADERPQPPMGPTMAEEPPRSRPPSSTRLEIWWRRNPLAHGTLLAAVTLLVFGALAHRFRPASAVPGGPSGPVGAAQSAPAPPVRPTADQQDLQRKCGEAAASAGLQHRVSTTDGMPQVLIPAGSYTMGISDTTIDHDQGPRRQVRLAAFWTDQLEVTVSQYGQFAEATGRALPDGNTDPWLPVVGVTWSDAVWYARWAGRQLPTEAQWEAAARGGSADLTYPWGNDWDETMANIERTGAVAVGTYPPNGYGLFDMAGNVWEWCRDWYDDGWYARMPEQEPVNNTEATYRVARGGSWGVLPVHLRVSHRGWFDPDRRSNVVGFRCVEGP